VSTEPDRDPVTDAFLRKALQPVPRIGADGCVDAETLAAWADGDLPADRAADVETHLAGCSRCQAVLGAFAMTDESAAPASSPAAVIPFRPKSPVRWLLPMAASIAATLVLWTAVRNRPTAPASTPELQQQLAKSVAETPAPRALADATAPASPVATPLVPADSRLAAARKEKLEVSAPKMSAAPAAGPVPAPAPSAMPPPPTLTLQPPPVMPPTANTAAATRDVVTTRTNAEPFRADSENWALAKVVAEFSPPAAPAPSFARPLAGGGGGGGRGGGGGAAGAGGGSRAAAAPAARAIPHVRWRVLASGQVLKSTDDGEWAVVTITPAVFILNGHAPSPTVCWLVGRAGIVMLSTDGTKFLRVRSPDLADLRSITAIDAQQATVTTNDGRVFTTFDAGETWLLK
jgi:hypothetical protein